jgi:hypothetical protein
MYDKLGLKQEDEKETKAREDACDTRGSSTVQTDFFDELVCGDQLPEEMVALCDWRTPLMNLGSRYKDMPTFRLAMRQFAIKKEFELGIESSSPIKYRGFCKGGDFPWRIHAREEIKGSPTIIVRFIMIYLIHKLHYMFCSMAS